MLIHNSGLPGIYLHIPFCIQKCGYCDFYSKTDLQLSDTFVKSLLDEIEIYHSELNSDSLFDTIYFGGGTPSILSVKQIEQIIERINKVFKISRDTEITLEMNPGTMETGKLADFKNAGINRLSIGVQSFIEDDLQFLERIHTVKETNLCLDSARSMGYDNISIDLIFGLSIQTLDHWRYNLSEAIKWSPEHLSAYNLNIEKNTPFYGRQQKGENMVQSEQMSEEMFMETNRILRKQGYIPYEISNYAKSLQTVSRHNIKYWYHVPYLGFGPAAHSYWQGKRWSNKADLKSYIVNLQKGQKPIQDMEKLSKETEEFEQIMLSLRTYQGLNLDRFSARFGHDFRKTYSQNVDLLLAEGLAELEEGFFRLSTKGLYISDELISNFHH